MNIITGMIRPEMNCAPKLALVEASFCASKSALLGPRPKTLTSSWPEKVSSMWRVEAAGAPPLGDELPLGALHDRARATNSGTATSATTASSGEIENIMRARRRPSAATSSSWLIVCWRVWLTLSMSLVTRLSSSPRGCRSK